MLEEMIGIVVLASREIESELEEHHGAVGKGLHTKTDSVEHKLPRDIVKRLRFIASVRNRIVHEHNYNFTDLSSFQHSVKSTLVELRSLSSSKPVTPEFVHEIIEEESNNLDDTSNLESNHPMVIYILACVCVIFIIDSYF